MVKTNHDLGTLITECEGGRNLCKEIFSKEKNVDILIDHLVCLCEEFHFDGWLINIENIIDVGLKRSNLFCVFLRRS
jgi:mannosyl-glycoprotein endo-beta-N-acetylglucosaminidase